MDDLVVPGGLIKGPISLRAFSTMSRKVETSLLSLKALLDKSLSIIDNSFYTGEEGWREQHKHVQGKDGVRLKQTFRLHTTSGQHKQSTKNAQTSEHHVIELKGGGGGLPGSVGCEAEDFVIIKLHFN